MRFDTPHRRAILVHVLLLGLERTEKICVGLGNGYVSCDQDRVQVGFIRRGLEKVLNAFSFVQRKMLSRANCSIIQQYSAL